MDFANGERKIVFKKDRQKDENYKAIQGSEVHVKLLLHNNDSHFPFEVNYNYTCEHLQTYYQVKYFNEKYNTFQK